MALSMQANEMSNPSRRNAVIVDDSAIGDVSNGMSNAYYTFAVIVNIRAIGDAS